MTLLDEIDIPETEELAERIAPYGDTSRGIRKSKPDDNGLVQYVWRMARFHTGADTHMPVTCDFWLKNWLESNGYVPEYDGTSATASERREIVSDFKSELESVIGEVIRDEFGMSDLEAAKRWSKAGLC
jgi:hypothetical protein